MSFFSIGKLDFEPAVGLPDLLAAPVTAALTSPQWPHSAEAIGVAEIDPDVADTAAFCERYDVSLAESANCVVIAGRREGETRFAACVILATTRADVNNVARRALDVRKASFAAAEVAVAETGMEYGGITPIGLPAGWPILVDAAAAASAQVIIGSGVRRSKFALTGQTLANLPGAVVVDGLAR
jgi:prolyl-tRNA editing enzyme YbaK/EbsC (Cys-tRNA(Pro) deacylase)